MCTHWIGGNFNLGGDIDLHNECVKLNSNKSGLSHQLLNIRKDNNLDQLFLNQKG